ncbi:MAG: hypothetical protein ACLU6B_00405 [Lachnospirales bacterium]
MWAAIVGASMILAGVFGIRKYCRKKIYRKTKQRDQAKVHRK